MAENIHNIDFKWLLEALAEGKGFEPSIPVSQYNGLANRRLQPLGHPSAGAACGNRFSSVSHGDQKWF